MFLQDPESPRISQNLPESHGLEGGSYETNRTTQTHHGAAERAEVISKRLGRPVLDHVSGIVRKRILDPRT